MTLAVCIICSLLAHEAGHAVVAQVKGLPWRVTLARVHGVPVAPAVLAPPSRAVALGGPLASLLAIPFLWLLSPEAAVVLGIIGGPVSLLPFPRSDGAHVWAK